MKIFDIALCLLTVGLGFAALADMIDPLRVLAFAVAIMAADRIIGD